MEHPKTFEFANNLDRINVLAEQSEGFVWRLKEDSGNATDIHAYDDELIIINMSVWKSIDHLKKYSYKTEHADFIRKRKLWFEPHAGAYMVLWWIDPNHVPTIEEAKIRLEYLDKNGESDYAFTFRKIFEPSIV